MKMKIILEKKMKNELHFIIIMEKTLTLTSQEAPLQILE